MTALESVGFGKKYIQYEHDYYPITGYRISKAFKTRTCEGLHDDVALISFCGFTPEDHFILSETSADQYIMPKEKQAGESGSPLFDNEGKICGVLSRSRLGKSIYSGIKLFGS